MRLKQKEDAAKAVALATAEEKRLLSEATAEYHAAARLVAKLPLDDLLTRLNRALVNVRPTSLGYPGFHDFASARGLIEFFLQPSPAECLVGCAKEDCESKQANRLSAWSWFLRGRGAA